MLKRILNAAADRLIARAQRTPYFHLEGYMERWWLFGGGATAEAGSRIKARIHHILRSDNDRDLHDHPWPYLTVILRGGYFEERPAFPESYAAGGPTTRRWYGPGSILFRRADALHRLDVPAGETAWTLFITGPKQRSWGFLTPKGWVHWRQYESALPEVAASARRDLAAELRTTARDAPTFGRQAELMRRAADFIDPEASAHG